MRRALPLAVLATSLLVSACATGPRSFPVSATRFHYDPVTARGTVSVEPLAGPTGLPAAEGTDPRRYASKGSEKYAYVLQSVTLERVGQPGSPVIGTDTPATWCLQSDPDSQGAGIVLALLSYEPTVASKAIALTADSVQTLKDRWTNLCGTPAPAASALYHFNLTPPGASVKGWTLNGMAWPDPPGSFRSAKPDTTLRISEPWRNRPDAAKALVVPALVLPGKADCYEKPVPPRRPWPGPIGPYRPVPPIFRGVSAASALSAAAIAPSAPVREAPAGSAADRIANLAAGRIAIADIRQPPPPPPPPGPAVPIGTTVPPRKLCDIRLLESPLFDDGRIFAPGTPANTAQSDIAALIAQLSGKPAPGPALSFGLKDRVLIECEAVERLVILLFVSTTLMRNEAMVLRRLDAAGAEIARTPLGFAQHITTAAQLPPRWRDPAGPWAETAV